MRTLLLLAGFLIALPSCDEPERGEVPRVADADADALAVALRGGPGSAEALSSLRAQGRPGFQRLHAYARDSPDWNRVLDAVAGQRDAAASGLFWETEPDAALASARERGLPVLSLRLLGALTDERSCANSRFFRTLLYADPDLATWLDENFVLLWTSERPVPQVTIDFGDGRQIQTTTTGNSAHYVLDHDGRVLDVLPGLYDAKTFRARLGDALALHAATKDAPDQRDDLIAAHHRDAAQAIERRVAPYRNPQIDAWMRQAPGATAAPVTALEAQPITASKRRVETPVLAGLATVAIDPVAPPQDLLRRLAPPVEFPPGIVDLIRRDRPQRADESGAAYEERIAALLRRTADDTALDSVVNEIRLHFQIHQWFANGGTDGTFDALNERVYTELFATPASDPWLGLVDDTSYDGLREAKPTRSG